MSAIEEIAIEKIVQSFDQPPQDEQYWQFLQTYNLTSSFSPAAGKKIDPFARKLPVDLKTYYFPRGALEGKVVDSTNLILLGREYSGKTTTMLRAADRLESEGYLVVPIRLEHCKGIVDEEEFRAGRISPLSLSKLPHFIFNALWEKFISAPEERDRDFHPYRRDQRWMDMLRFFYQEYKPVYSRLENEFELKCWVESKIRDVTNLPKTDYEKLASMIWFVTYTLVEHFPEKKQKYKGVAVLVDEFDHLVETPVTRLLDDFDQLIDLHLQDLQVKLFAHIGQSRLVNRLDTVRQEDVAVFRFPEWTETDTLKLLLTRPLIATNRLDDLQIEMYKINVEQLLRSEETNWSLRMVPWGEKRGERSSIFRQLVQSSLRTYAEHDDFDVPYHALTLSRGLICIFARVFPDISPSDFSDETFKALFDAYWRCMPRRG